MRPVRIVSLVIGSLLVIPAVALLFGGGALGLAYAFGRGDDGYFDTTLSELQTDTVAVTAEDITFATDPGSPDWVLDVLDADVRLRVNNLDNERDVFIGIARASDLDAYLAGVAHEEIVELTDDLEPVYRTRDGGTEIAAPTTVTFWAASSTGPGAQELEWEATTGQWSAIVMNADGNPGVRADVNVAAKAAFVFPLAMLLLGAGALLTAAAVVMIVAGAHGAGRVIDLNQESSTADDTTPVASAVPAHPLTLTAHLDSRLSRWMWLVKWFLAIPHVIALAFLWVAFVVLTFVAAVAIVFTGSYPRGIFDFNVGVLRWSWRVSHYASTGGLGTDRYPPFTLQPAPGDLATLDVAYPERLSRGLVFVKWLLALPHVIIVAILAGGSVRWFAFDGDSVGFDPTGGGGLLGLLGLIAGFALLFTGRYPRALFDLIIGLNRWVYRTVVYLALMTDEYPPFRLDQGGGEPTPEMPRPPTSGSDGTLSSDRVDRPTSEVLV